MDVPGEPGGADTSRRLHDLAADECWSLAASRTVGRLAWSGSEGPVVIPVNFTVDGQHVHVRTAAYSTIARECDDSQVAFEVDDLDEVSRTGWSVLMRGVAHLDYEGGHHPDDPEVWPAGARALRVSVDVDLVSGRRLGAGS